jgi:hydrogenase-4 component E
VLLDLAGGVLVLSSVLALWRPSVRFLVLQGIALAVLAGAADNGPVAAGILVLNAGLLPYLVSRAPVGESRGFPVALVIAAGLTVLGFAVAAPLAQSGVAIGIAVALIGFLMVANGRSVGFLLVDNGITAVAVLIGMSVPAIAGVGITLDALCAVLTMPAMITRVSEAGR